MRATPMNTPLKRMVLPVLSLIMAITGPATKSRPSRIRKPPPTTARTFIMTGGLFDFFHAPAAGLFGTTPRDIMAADAADAGGRVGLYGGAGGGIGGAALSPRVGTGGAAPAMS